MAYGDLKVRNLIWNTGSGDNTVVLSTLATQSYVTTNFAPKANPTFTGTINGADLILSGNLTVSGTQTIINTNVLQVEDKHIEIGKVSSPSDTTADGGGIILKASSDRTFVWINSTDAWTSSEHIQVASGKTFIGDGSTLTALNATNLASGTVPTARLGSGTAGSTNFLRGDGSWQAIATDKIEEGNTSVETVDTGSDGHVKISTEGTERVRVIADGKVGIGDSSPTKPLTVGTTTPVILLDDQSSRTLEIRGPSATHNATVLTTSSHDLLLGTNNSERFRVGSSGQLGVAGANYGTSGQVLTSGGASAAPSWTTISAAPEITATAHGTVTAEKAVIVRSDGKVETVANVPASNGSFTNMNPFNNQGKLTRIASNNNGQYVLLEDTNVSNGLQATVLTVSGTTVTKNSATSITTTCSQTSNDDRFDISYDSTADKFVVVYIHSSTANVQAKTVTISGTGSSASISQGTELTIGSSVSQFCRVAYDPDQDKTALIADVSGDGFAWGLTVSGTNLSASSHVQIDEGKTPFQQPNMCYDNKNKKFQILWRQSSSGIIRPQTLTWNASNARYNGYSGTPPILWSNGYEGPISIAHVKDTDGYVCHYKRSDNIMYARLITCNSTGSTITAGSETQIHASYAYRSGDMKHDSLNDKMMLISRGTDGYIDYKILSYNVTNRTVSVDSTTILANTSTNPNSNTFVAEGINAAFDTTNNIFVASFAKNQSGSYSTNQVMAFQRPSTTLDATKFIGFASSTVTDGNTATVKVASNTSTQSSLTPAIKYYVQGDGTVGATASTPSVEAGVALSSTKLLIKG